MNLQDVQTTSLVWERNLDLAIHTTRSQQGWIKSVRSVGRHYAFDFAKVVKAIKLVQKLHKSALNLTIGTRAVVESLASNSINFIDKNDAWLVVFRKREHLSDCARTLTDILVDYC